MATSDGTLEYTVEDPRLTTEGAKVELELGLELALELVLDGTTVELPVSEPIYVDPE